MAIRESDCQNPAVNLSETIEALLRLAVRQILGNHTLRVGKGKLGS